MKLKRRTEQNTSLRITPLIDVVLLLLIFFLLTSSFVAPSSVDVDLPETKGGGPAKKTPLRITITRKGAVFLNEEEVSLDELRTKLSKKSDRDISIYGDKKSSLGTFLKVWDTLRTAGVDLFQVRVIPEVPDREGSSKKKNGS